MALCIQSNRLLPEKSYDHIIVETNCRTEAHQSARSGRHAWEKPESRRPSAKVARGSNPVVEIETRRPTVACFKRLCPLRAMATVVGPYAEGGGATDRYRDTPLSNHEFHATLNARLDATTSESLVTARGRCSR